MQSYGVLGQLSFAERMAKQVSAFGAAERMAKQIFDFPAINVGPWSPMVGNLADTRSSDEGALPDTGVDSILWHVWLLDEIWRWCRENERDIRAARAAVPTFIAVFAVVYMVVASSPVAQQVSQQSGATPYVIAASVTLMVWSLLRRPPD